MRIYLNRRPVVGPWGGGNRFISELALQLKALHHDVTYELDDHSDVYVCFDPRPNSFGVSVDDFREIYRRCDGSKIVCRVGDLGTHGKPEIAHLWSELLGYAAKIVFPSGWARDYCRDVVMSRHASHIDNHNVSTIIANGADERFIIAHSLRTEHDGLTNVITHHWSDNPMKGFNVYDGLSRSAAVDFTYVGRTIVPFKHHIPPCDVPEIIKHLSAADVYLTASKAEAGANHVLEAMALGLPVVYSCYGGSIVEYCYGRGIEYDGTVEGALEAIAACRGNVYPRYTRSTVDAVHEFIGVITR